MIIDKDGYRTNIGIIIMNHQGQLFWGRRVGTNSWQFPQGGVLDSEQHHLEQTLYRELYEEVGLKESDIKIIKLTKYWLRYDLPRPSKRENSPWCIGQKQRWFLVKLITDESNINFDITLKPEFDGFRWVNYWYPLRDIVKFKRKVYRQALTTLASYALTSDHKGRTPLVQPIDFILD